MFTLLCAKWESLIITRYKFLLYYIIMDVFCQCNTWNFQLHAEILASSSVASVTLSTSVAWRVDAIVTPFARNSTSPDNYDRTTGRGRVRARKGQYADAIAKHSRVHLAHAESSGALSPTLVDLIATCRRRLKHDKLDDTTIYGSSRTSTK